MSPTRRLLPLVATFGIALGGSALVTTPFQAAATTSTTTPATTSTTTSATTTATAAVPTVTVRPDPSYQGAPYQGWGTSLAWFANATGGYPDEVRDRLAEMVFGEDGLNLNIARYNIGGGNAPDVTDYLRPGGAVEGWWHAPDGTTREDTDWWDPDNPDHWNWDADRTQRWWVDRIKGDVTTWETFGNSPPWFQTVSGYVSGGFDSNQEQIRSDTVDEFATYLVRVTKELERAHGITVDTLDPLNEPNTPYWGTRLDENGEPVGGRQEGAHAGPGLQQQVIRAVAAELLAEGSVTRVSAMDETNPGRFATNWNSYDDETRAMVSQLNVHTYGTGQRTTVRDIAKGEDKPLWMSEVEGSWGTGQSFTSMEPGLGMAGRIVDDLRELEPSAWVFWQPVEDYDNMAPGGESELGANWGSIQLPFDCTASDTLETCPIYTNTKYDTVRNFTHYIRPGDRLVGINDTSSVAAISSGKRATVVHVNSSSEQRLVELDLSGFVSVAPDATATPVVTRAGRALEQQAAVPVVDRAATIEVPAQSVTTFLVDGVSGVDKFAPIVQEGHIYRLQGVQSGKSLTAQGSGTVIRTSDQTRADQLWRLTKLTDGVSNRERYVVTTATTNQALAVVDGGLALVPAVDEPPASAQWIASTTGDSTYTWVNAATGRVLEVGGQATQDGAAVGTWLANSGNNQRWRVVDETVTGFEPVKVFTLPGTAPELPDTVVPVYRDGARGALPVTWQLPPASAWSSPRTVEVTGHVTDPTGRKHAVQATVVVDRLASTLPARAKAYVGGTPSLPTTVTAVTEHGETVPRPATWDEPAPGSFDEPGVVTLTGQADAGDGGTLPATVRVQVTPPVQVNAALAEGTTALATFTEPGYSASGLVNGDLTDKAWSNWQPNTWNPSDTLTVTLPEQRDVSGLAVHFYRDGRDSYAATLSVQARDAAGGWMDVAGPVTVPTGTPSGPVVDVDVPTTRTDAVRVLLTAPNGGYMTVSEIEVFAPAPGVSSDADAASILLDGVPLPGFDPDVTSYQVAVSGSLAQLTATGSDPYAVVDVSQPSRADRTGVVTITSEDGSHTRTYTVELTG